VVGNGILSYHPVVADFSAASSRKIRQPASSRFFFAKMGTDLDFRERGGDVLSFEKAQALPKIE
jgi:hypothetical protein